MTLLETPRALASTAGRSTTGVVATAVVAGIVLGVGDLTFQRTAPYPWAELGDSSALWAIAALAFGAWVGTRRGIAPLAGVVLLVVAVEVYYLDAVLTLHDATASLWSTNTQMWLFFGVVGGAVFGLAGAWARDGHAWQRAVGLAMGAGVLFAEAAIDAIHTEGLATALHLDPSPVSGLVALTGLAVLATGVRRPLVLVAACLLSVPFAAVCFAAFRAAGWAI